FARAIAAAPAPSAFGAGGHPNGLPSRFIATPHWAIAQPGSFWAIATKASIDAENQNEWSMATARSNSAWTAGLHDVSNLTVPTLSSAVAPAAARARRRGGESGGWRRRLG